MNALPALGIKDLRTRLKKKQVSVREIAEACLERIEEADERLGTFLTIDPDEVLREAEALDLRLHKGEIKLGFLTGIPIAVKDNIVTTTQRTTCGSRILENYRSPYDATVIEKLRSDGALLIGKTNCDEFAMGSSNENSAFGPVRNPWDLQRVSGGSSGGSAAAVASGQVPAALGSDTGGSIRQPAAFCGTFGLKPTYGRVSRYGLIAFASSLDQIGPIASSARDLAALLQVIAGHDRKDSTSAAVPAENYLSQIHGDVRGLKIGIVSDWMAGELDTAVKHYVGAAVERAADLGCEIHEVELPHTQYAVAAYYIIAPAEASSNLARYDGVRYGFRAEASDPLREMYEETRSQGFGDEVKRRILIGTYALSSGYYDAYYLKAARVRTLISRDFEEAFRKVDLLVGPTTPTPPFKLGEKVTDPLEMYLSDIFTLTASLAGLPALSMPCGFSDAGLPVGLQIIGPAFNEGRVLRFAHNLEQLIDLHPPLQAV